MKPIWGKSLYAALFGLGLPLLLGVWTMALNAKFDGRLPGFLPPLAGVVVAFAGAVLMLRAMWDLWRTGGGLPMNAYPPPHFVATGAYRWFAHPIYLGFGLLVPGVMIALGSAPGWWVVTPTVWLAMVALVVGYERISLQQRFGASTRMVWMALPPDAPEPSTAGQRAAAFVLAFVPWALAYQACAQLGPGRVIIDTMLPFERNWPVWEWTGVFYLGVYGWAGFAPWAANSQSALRQFTGTSLWGTAAIAWCFLVFPFAAGPRPIEGSSVIAALLRWDRAIDTTLCAFPSFHVFWAFAAAEVWRARIGAVAATAVAILISASCVTTGVHSLLDVIAGWAVYVGAAHRRVIWAACRDAAERVANSWHDWRLGPVRIINHGAYVAAATVLGLWLAGMLLGPRYLPAIATVALCGVLGAGVWGQWLEASSQLARPFGYFGGLFGCCAGVIVVQFWWGLGWPLLGAFAVAAPLIQAVGRLRCLVQGCCHGRPASADWLGIHHTQPLSRVCRLAKLDGVAIYPTPLYSIIGNLLILGLLLRLWSERADCAFIGGIYFILCTCARFMEEGYRGEPQTLRWGGLAIYQWLAIACLLAGIALTTLPAPATPPWSGFSMAPLVAALPIGLLVWFCMGVDFPESDRRMSRLA